MSVLLPAPFSPTSASTSPLRTERSTPARATVAPKRLWTPCIFRRSGDATIRKSPHPNPSTSRSPRTSRSTGRGDGSLDIQKLLHFRIVQAFLGDQANTRVDHRVHG